MARLAPWHLEPRQQMRRLPARPALGAQVHAAARIAKTQSREGVDDETQPCPTAQVVLPLIRRVTIHVREKLVSIGTPDEFTRFGAKPQFGREFPLRKQAGVHRSEEHSSALQT